MKYTSKSKLIICGLILGFAIVGGGTASFSAMSAMLDSEFSQPCYAGLWTSRSGHENDLLSNITSGITITYVLV